MTTEDLHRPRAERYAAALAAAAAAESRIKELTDVLADHEWHRTQAEMQLEAVRADERFGTVWTAADGEPPLQVEAVLCLATGAAFVRATRFNGSTDPNCWVRAAASQAGQTRREWPIEDAGPFILLPDGWHLYQVMRDARAREEAEDAIRNLLRDRPGYYAEGESRFGRPDLAQALTRVVNTLTRERAEAREEALKQQQRAIDAESALAAAMAGASNGD